MKITRDVVMDLLPLYAAGEASADTRALVEEFLRQDPELERRAREARLESLTTEAPRPVVPPDVELRSLRRTHGVLRWQRLMYAWALTFSFLSLSSAISYEDGHLHVRLLVFELPHVFGACIVLALACWANYFFLRKRARVTRI